MKQVFLSSVSKNLRDYRDAAYSAIQRLDGHHCVRMEDFGARDSQSDDFCRKKVGECDIFVAVIGPDYGSCPEGSNKSYTEREYDAAFETSKRLLVFCTYDDFSIPADLAETDESRSKQLKFRKRAKYDRQVALFRHPEELARLVTEGLVNLDHTHDPHLDVTISLFPFVTNIAGLDTGLSVCNISGPPFDYPEKFGTCTFHFYGYYAYGGETDEEARYTTLLIPAGTTHTNLLSSLRPGSQGHLIAVCRFPARGFALVTDSFGGPGRGVTGSYVAEVIQSPTLRIKPV